MRHNQVKAFFTVGFMVLVALSFTPGSEGAILFSDDFSSGVFGPAWVANDPGNGETAVADSGGGDFAAFTVGPTPYDSTDWQYNFHSVASYPRGNDLRCTFKTWRDPSKPTWAGAVNFGILGPFHLTTFNPAAVYGNMAVAVEGGAVPMAFNSKGPWTSGTPVSAALSSAFNSSTSKADGVWIRVTLGNTSGGLLEYSTDGVTYTLDTDNRDLPDHNTAAEVILGFGTHAGAVWIDDIVVDDSIGPPAPNLRIDPLAGINFGFEQEGGAAGPVQCVTLENIGAQDLTFTSITITGTDAAQFQFDSAPSLDTLPPGSTRDVCVVYDPADGTGGDLPHTAAVAVVSNDPDTPTANIPLRGVSTDSNPPAMETLLAEDWSSGGFDEKWTLYNDPGNGEAAVEMSDGDFAAYTVGPDPYDGTEYSYYYYSANTYPRGNSLRCSFLVWRDPTKPTWAGPINFGVFGPFHNHQNQAAIYGSLEAGLQGGSLPLDFNATGMFNQGTPLSPAFFTAFNSSTSRTNGVYARVTLGDTMGGRFEWSSDGSNYLPEVDSREISGATTTNVYLGFGTHAGAVFIDNILLERINPTSLKDWQLY